MTIKLKNVVDNKMNNPRSELYNEIKALLPEGRKKELLSTLNIKYGSVKYLKEKLEEVKNINFSKVEKPVNLDEKKKIIGIEVNFEWVRKASLPEEVLNKEPEPILETASSLEKRNYKRRYNYWIKNVVYVWLRNQPKRYGKRLLKGIEREIELEPIPIKQETYRFAVNEGRLEATLEAFKKKFIDYIGSPEYCLILQFDYKKTEDIINRSFMDVKLRYTEKKLNFFDNNGNVIVDNDDKMDGLCIPRLIQKEIFPKKSLDKIIDDMEDAFLNAKHMVIFADEDCVNPLKYEPKIDIRKNGITLRELEPYCRKYRIKVKVYDVDETLLYEYKPEKADHHKTTLMFILHDGHPYSIIDKVRRLQLSSKKQNVLTRLEILQKEEEEDNDNVFIHRRYIRDAPYDFDNIVGDFYTDDFQDLRDLFIWLYLKQGKIPKYKNDGENITKILINPNCNLFYNREYDIYKDKEDFNNHSSSSIAYDYFKDLDINNKMNINNLKSTFNKKTLEFCNLTHSFATTKQFKKPEDINNCVQYDINKQYSSILENAEMGWLVVSNKEDVKKYNGEQIFDNTLYYVEPSNFNPLIYTYGVYYGKLVRVALEDKLITKSEIKYSLKCNFETTKTFNKFVGKAYEDYQDKAKHIVNHYVGTLGRRNKKIGKLVFGENLQTMYNNYFLKEEIEFAYKYGEYEIMNKETGKLETRKLFLTSSVREIDNNNSLFMIRNQVIQYGNLQSYELSKKIGGTLIKIATDSVLMENPKNTLELSDKRGGLKLEKPKQLGKIDNEINKDKEYIHEKIELEIINIDDEYDFEELYTKTKNKSFFLTGQAGTGKSVVSNKYIEKLESEGKNIRKCAPTHIAGKSINGITCHKSFGYDICKKTHRSDYSSVDYIIIDEISMCDAIFYNEMNYIKRNNPSVIFICFGDFNQLPPINHQGKPYLYYTMFKHIFENIITFKINKRCGKEGEKMFKLIEEILDENRIESNKHFIERNFKKAEYQEKLNLCYTNARRKEINQHCMDIFKPDDAVFIEYKPEQEEEEYEYDMENDTLSLISNEEEKKVDYSQSIYLYQGLPLRSRRTYPKNKKNPENDINIVNGDQFLVVDYNDKEVLLFKDNSRFPNYNPDEVEEFSIKLTDNFLKYFNPNYAMTIHSSQCQSFNEPYTLHEIEKYDKHLLNVAVSRTRKLDYISYS